MRDIVIQKLSYLHHVHRVASAFARPRVLVTNERSRVDGFAHLAGSGEGVVGDAGGAG